MKITTLLLVAVILHVSAATSLAQKVTLNEKNVALVDVFNKIRVQTGYDFSFSTETLENSKPVTINVKNEDLNDVLAQIFRGQNLEFSLNNKIVTVKPKEESLIDKAKALFAQVTVSGKVVDETGQPLVGVTVRIKNTNSAIATDKNGAYTINAPDNNSIVVFSYIGYETQELKAGDILNGSVITLKAVAQNLHEVIVNKGYYVERQELSTGNVAKVTSNVIEEQPVTDPILALEGRVAGLSVAQTSGIPGGYSNIQLRGTNSLPGPNKLATWNDPLYIVDGVPYSSNTPTNPFVGGGAVGTPGTLSPNQLYSTRNPRVGLSPFNNLNPSDIESIEVLKDGDATAIYGSKGANGVILITTKKGKVGDTKVNFDLSQGIGQVDHMIPLLNTQQYLQMRHQAFNNDGVTSIPATNYDINGTWDTTRYTNWEKLMIGNTAHYTNAQVSVSGGNTNTQFLISGGYSRQTTVFPGDFEDRKGLFNINLTHTSTNQHFHIQFSAGYVNDNSNLPVTDFTFFINLPPDAPNLYDANGNLNWAVTNGSPTWSNPYSYKLPTSNAVTNSLTSNLNIRYQLLPGLDISSNFGYIENQSDQTNITPATSYAPPNNNNPSVRLNTFGTTNYDTWIIEPQLSYQKKIGKGLFNVLLGSTFEEDQSKSSGQNASGFSSDALISNPAAAASVILVGNNNTQYNYNAVFARIAYSWEDKYLLNVTARRDGSSRFGPGRQWGNFGAIGAGWIFSKEKWISDHLSFLSFGKLRGSYGTTGNDKIKDYGYLSTYSPISTTYQGITGLSPTQISNPDYAWEKVSKLEFGLDLGLLKDRVNITASYFRNRTTDQLVSYTLPNITGFTSVVSNLPATIQNAGLELTLNTVNLATKNFSWNTAINLTVPRSELVAFPNVQNTFYGNSLIIGKPLNVIKLYDLAGVNPTTGLYQFRAADGSLTSKPSSLTDKTAVVNLDPTFFGGIQNSFRYQGLQLDIFFQFVKQEGKNVLFSGTNAIGFNLLNDPSQVLQRWQHPGDVSSVEKFTGNRTSLAGTTYSTYAVNSTGAYTDASFIRLKNVALSFLLPQNWQQKAHLQNAKIYLQCQNLLTITRYQGLDPETGAFSNLPPLRMISLGIRTSL